ncbi:MAG: DUF945 family protein [Idiomarina sp.]|nr:DUF945 family protein [Idiomarina sp.]
MKKIIIGGVVVALVAWGIGVSQTSRQVHSFTEELIENANIDGFPMLTSSLEWKSQGMFKSEAVISTRMLLGIPDVFEPDMSLEQNIVFRHGFLRSRVEMDLAFSGDHEEILNRMAEEVEIEGIVSLRGATFTTSIKAQDFEYDGVSLQSERVTITSVFAGDQEHLEFNLPNIRVYSDAGEQLSMEGLIMRATNQYRGQREVEEQHLLFELASLKIPDLAAEVKNVRSTTATVVRENERLTSEMTLDLPHIRSALVNGDMSTRMTAGGVDASVIQSIQKQHQEAFSGMPNVEDAESLDAWLAGLNEQLEPLTRQMLTRDLYFNIDDLHARVDDIGTLRTSLTLRATEDMPEGPFDEAIAQWFNSFAVRVDIQELPMLAQVFLSSISADPLPWVLEYQNEQVTLNGQVLEDLPAGL